MCERRSRFSPVTFPSAQICPGSAQPRHGPTYGVGPTALFLPNVMSDLVVPTESQRNVRPSTPQNQTAGQVIDQITHSYFKTQNCIRANPAIRIEGEPDSLRIRNLTLQLLGKGASPFDPAWQFE